MSLIENVYEKDTFNVNSIFLSYIFNIKIVEVKETYFNMIKKYRRFENIIHAEF